MDLDRPFVAALFVAVVFLAPFIFATGLFLFLMCCSFLSECVPEARARKLIGRAHVPNPAGFSVIGYVRLSSHCRFDEERISWKSEIHLGVRPIEPHLGSYYYWRGPVLSKALRATRPHRNDAT
jgi:hypothetical protein